MSKRSKTLALLLSLVLTSMGIEIARADSYTWSPVSTSVLSTTYGAKAVGISSDGTTIIVGRAGDGVYVSTDSGASFAKVAVGSIPNGTYMVAISSNGMKMLAGSNSSHTVYYSTDRGATWSTNTTGTSSSVNRVCMSGDGSRWIVLANLGVSISTNNGVNWSTNGTLSVGSWTSCAMSNDGSKIFLHQYGGALKYSINSGTSWSTSTNTYSSSYTVASSFDGTRIVLTDRNNMKVYTSTDYGASFTERYTASAAIYDVAMSSDGMRIAIAVSSGRIALSLDGGLNWATESSTPVAPWNAIAMTRDGARLFIATSNSGNAYYFGLIPQPASVTLQSISPNASPLIYSTGYTLTVLSNSAGKVTFFANGKKISKCSQIPTVSLVATCAFKPNIHGVITLTARVVPSDSAYISATSQFLQTSAVVRTSKR